MTQKCCYNTKMRTELDIRLAKDYTSMSQKMRVLTESWVGQTVFCPNCGRDSLTHHANNKPVADFYCADCQEEYELKSKREVVGTKIVDGAYGTMISRLQSSSNPNFFLLNYRKEDYMIKNFFVIPKHFFTPGLIEKRKPLAAAARRAGWIGCNILLKNIPQTGKIFYIRDGRVEEKEAVLANWKKTIFLREQKELSAKGWLLDVMRMAERIGKQEFTLDEIYAFEDELSILHPDNKHIKDKIRQQLQVLRDKEYLMFVSPGRYRLT